MDIQEIKKGLDIVMKDLQEELETAEREGSSCFMFKVTHVPWQDKDGSNEYHCISLGLYKQNYDKPSLDKEYLYLSYKNWEREEKEE